MPRVRSLAVILLAAAAFGAFLFVNHRRASDLVDAETVVLERFRAYLQAPERTPLEDLGYHFHWETDGTRPALAVAGPLQPRESGVRWFAGLAGGAPGEVFEFDTVLSRAPGGVPNFDALRTFLSLPESERTRERWPFGWRLVAPAP